MPVRPSSLNVARHCQLSPVLSARYPETNANIARGNEVDAQVADWINKGTSPTDPAAWAATRWVSRHLTDVRAKVGCHLMDSQGRMLWAIDQGESDIVGRDSWDAGLLIVVDLKKREQWINGKLPPPDENLQLHAYAIAQALVQEVGRYRTALLLFGDDDVESVWSREYTRVEWTPILKEIENICAHKPSDGRDPIGKAGPHCTNCYSRLHCRHWTLPAFEGGGSALAELSSPTANLTPERAGQAYLALKALREVYERGDEILKAYQRAGGLVLVGDKEWRPTVTQGKKSADVAALERDGLRGYIKTGQHYETWRLVKRR